MIVSAPFKLNYFTPWNIFKIIIKNIKKGLKTSINKWIR